MKSHVLLLLPILLISNFLIANASPKTVELTSLAKQQYTAGNYDNAISLYKQAEVLGDPNAMLQLSYIYKIGKGIPKDTTLSKNYLEEAITGYKKLADNGDPNAQYNLGRIYTYFIKPPKKLEAFNWYQDAANNGHMKAQFAVATTLDKGDLELEIKKNHEQAVKWYEKSAMQGNSRAAYKLTSKDIGSMDNAIKWCMPVVKQQYDKWSSKCLELLNYLAGSGLHSEKYKQKSIDIMHKLADRDIVMSQVALSQMYKDGKIVTKDLVAANKWSSKAFNTALSKSQVGDRQSQYELSLLYKKGIGTDVYIDEAHKWLTKSAEQGYKKAIKELAILNKK